LLDGGVTEILCEYRDDLIRGREEDALPAIIQEFSPGEFRLGWFSLGFHGSITKSYFMVNNLVFFVNIFKNRPSLTNLKFYT
jgi:hypothetical protein